MPPRFRIAGLGRPLLAGAALWAAGTAIATEKRVLTIGATVVRPSECRIDTFGGRCNTATQLPAFIASAEPGANSYRGQLLVKMTPQGASLDSRSATAASTDRIVLTIAP